MAILFYVICAAWCQWHFLMFLSMNDFLPGCLFAVVITCFMIGVNVWWVYLAPQNIYLVQSVYWHLAIKLYCVGSRTEWRHATRFWRTPYLSKPTAPYSLNHIQTKNQNGEDASWYMYLNILREATFIVVETQHGLPHGYKIKSNLKHWWLLAL